MPANNGEVKRGDSEGGLLIIPAAIMRLPIPAQAKFLFGAIWAIVQMRSHKCWATNWRLAEIIGCKPDRHFKRSLACLEQFRLIERVSTKDNHRDQIRILWSPDTVIEQPHRGVAKNATGGGGKKRHGGGGEKRHPEISSEKQGKRSDPPNSELPNGSTEAHRGRTRTHASGEPISPALAAAQAKIDAYRRSKKPKS